MSQILLTASYAKDNNLESQRADDTKGGHLSHHSTSFRQRFDQ
ncbi:hypothetical protein RO3G_04276 [Rhizopus delemar RA 99-880]|uniref:Uncharacterized protein n=1 Tax=Rhizopus delemar (strain RA 99-880 / ATCC MYA-4621 / FGSC 9543 / NRRL 43880) TaxID=246409 RepID=I1BTP1_RHIO9|nr:hypothetical protein RO3G_04276 [Rhizopus delemar RA 99-880]|eukprot:EIE79571.1 hypothetical protein RO3G_04276 [Rhizopus delemar RA 99-880]